MLRRFLSICCTVLFLVLPARAADGEYGYDGWLRTTIRLRLPPGLQHFEIGLGAVLLSDDPGVQALLVTRVEVENPEAVIDSAHPNAWYFDEKKRNWTFRFKGSTTATLHIQGYCLHALANLPTQGGVGRKATMYFFSGRRMPFADLDRLMKSPNRQGAVWAAVDGALGVTL